MFSCPDCGSQVLDMMPGEADILGCENCGHVCERQAAQTAAVQMPLGTALIMRTSDGVHDAQCCF